MQLAGTFFNKENGELVEREQVYDFSNASLCEQKN